MRRGIKEMDIILMRFSDTRLGDLDGATLDLYDELLSENDHDIYQWVRGQIVPPERYGALVGEIAHNGKFNGID
jgi:antitoxin CptB